MDTTLGKTTTLGTQLSRLYRPLARWLATIVLVTGVSAALAVAYFDEHLVRSLSQHLIDASRSLLAGQIERPFTEAENLVQLALSQTRSVDIDSTEDERLYQDIEPFLQRMPLLDSVNLANDRGAEFVVIRQEVERLTRFVDADQPDTANWQRWSGRERVESWTRTAEVSPLERPWYQGASAVDPGTPVWSDPYQFLTTQEPGISVSSSVITESGSRHVMAFNMTLTEISDYTIGHRPSPNGLTMVFTESGQVLGLPADERFSEPSTRRAAVLSAVDSLGIEPLQSAMTTWTDRNKDSSVFEFSAGDGARWWAGVRGLGLGKGMQLIILVPESDFLGTIRGQRNLVLGGIGLAGLAAVLLLIASTMARVRRQMKAAMDRVERKLGQYHLRKQIGQGGNGTVYLADHALLRRPTAIKLMNPGFAESDQARERFEHEVRITSSLSHPNTIAIYDYGKTPEGTLYYAMELLVGQTLEAIVRSTGPMPPERVVHVLTQVAGSLAEAHDRQLIHRDIKPSNIILCERGGVYDVAKVLDFGLVKEIADLDGELTQDNVLVGTPLYMAPETIRESGRAGPQSDLYAVGAVAYFLLTGQTVFEGQSAIEICAKHLNEVPVRPSARAGIEIPDGLEALVLRLLEKEPDGRPAGARDLLAELRQLAVGPWTEADAVDWWRGHSGLAAGSGGASDEATPLSDTEMLVDLEERLEADSTGPRVGQRVG